MSRRTFWALLAGAAAVLAGGAPASPQPSPEVDRSVEHVILQGSVLPTWSRLPAIGQAEPWPSGSNEVVTEVRDAHNGRFFIPGDDPLRAVVPEDIAAFRWGPSGWEEIPVQVDQRFPYFLANGRSNFGFYSGTDEELTYQWDEETWKKIAGVCTAAYPPAEADPSRYPGYPTVDPVSQLDDDDEIVFMATDAGAAAPSSAPAPSGASEEHQEITLTDPLSGDQSYVYLFVKPGGSSFDAGNGYVDYRRDPDADEYIDRNSFPPGSPEQLGSSNTGYGPNLPGPVCDPNGNVRSSNDRFPRDGVTVRTDAYRWRATGRWMVREMRVALGVKDPGCMRAGRCVYGDDLIDRWKGRAFQQSPDSEISFVGFEDEQVNWEANSALLGERVGPVRAIRETWGADSGTNVTKREYFYRDSIVNRYFLRVHPIPPDGIYTSWDHDSDVAVTYYNEDTPEGVPIDGTNDDIGNVDEVPVTGNPAYFDATDPTFSRPISIFNWEQVSGSGTNGSVVYMFQFNNVQGFEHPDVIPYYRDDQCFDDGTGDDPVPRPWPGEPQEDSRLADYRALDCTQEPPVKQGCFACHGIHYLVTSDTDNTFFLKPTTEIDGQQYQWAAPTLGPENVGDRYANTVKFALVPSAVLVPTSGATPSPSPEPTGSSPDPSASPASTATPSPGPGGSETPAPGSPSPSGSPAPGGGSPPPSGSPGPDPSPAGSGSSPSPTATATSRPTTSPGSEPSFAQGDPRGRATTTIESRRSRIRYKGRTTFRGLVRTSGPCDGPFRVSLYRKQFGEEVFTEVAAVAGVRGGEVWRKRASARFNSEFVARVDGPADDPTPCRPDFSPAATLLVEPRIRVTHAGSCRGPHTVRGSIRPRQPGTRILLLSRRILDRIDSDRLGRTSTFSLRAPSCGRYRIVWPTQGKRNIGTSIRI